MKRYGNNNYNVHEINSNLYRAQNKSIVVTMVWLIGLAAVALGVVVMAGQMGIF